MVQEQSLSCDSDNQNLVPYSKSQPTRYDDYSSASFVPDAKYDETNGRVYVGADADAGSSAQPFRMH